MVWKHNLHNCSEQASTRLRLRKRLKSGPALKRACAGYSKGLSRKAFRIVAATAALVLGLLDALPVNGDEYYPYPDTEYHVVFHNWDRDWISNNIVVDDYDGSVRLDSDTPGLGQEFTTGPGEFDPYVDAYLLTYFNLSVARYSDNVTGLSVRAGIYRVNDDGTRGALVQHMTTDGMFHGDDNNTLIFTPRGEPVPLQPQTRYMFALICTNCDDGEERFMSFDSTTDPIDNDHEGSVNYVIENCRSSFGEAPAECRAYPPNHTGWELANHHVRAEDGWADTGREHILITEGRAIWLYYPEAPTNLTALPVSNTMGYVFLAWNSPERQVYTIPTSLFDLDICCNGPLPPPPEDDPEITHHEYRYKRSDTNEDDGWGEWTEIPFSAPGQLQANQFTVTGLPNAVPLQFQVRAVNEDGPSPPADTADGMAGAGFGICDRSLAVRDAIVEKLGADNCAEVTDLMLYLMTGRLTIRTSGYDYKVGDFFGMQALEALVVSGTSLSAIRWEMLRDLTSLTSLDLSDNKICRIKGGALDHPTALEVLLLNDNHLGDISACPGDVPSVAATVFNKLTALQSLNLNDNRLSELSFKVAGTTYAELPSFRKLTALTEIKLRGNGLENSHLQKSFYLGGSPGPVSIFTGLPGLEVIDLSNNRLSAPLPDKVFSGLSNLRALYLDRNADDPMVMTVSLATDGASGVKAVMPTGAPFTMHLPVNVAEGSIPGGNEIMISTGATESGVYQVTSNTRTVQNPAVTIASLPALPASHIGYELRDSGEQPPTITDTDLPAFSITDAWGNEPDSDVSGSGGGYIEFTITLSGTLAEDARVSYATSVESGQTATSGEDFSSTRGSKLFLSSGHSPPENL